MAKNNKQSGNSLIVIILVIAVIAVAGVIIWRVFFNQTSSTSSTTSSSASGSNSSQTTSTNSTKTDPNAGYYVIDEWDLRLKPIDSSQEIVYTINSTGDTLVFSTSALSALTTSCSDSQTGEKPLGELIKLTSAQATFEPTTDNGGAFIKLINGNYYQFITPQTSCSSDSTIASTQNTIYNSFFKPSIATLEAEEE